MSADLEFAEAIAHVAASMGVSPRDAVVGLIGAAVSIMATDAIMSADNGTPDARKEAFACNIDVATAILAAGVERLLESDVFSTSQP